VGPVGRSHLTLSCTVNTAYLSWKPPARAKHMDQAIGEVVKRIFENDIDGARHAMKKLPRREMALSSHYILQQCIDEENIGTEQADLRSIGKRKRAHDR
jgi:hypothetical protein